MASHPLYDALPTTLPSTLPPGALETYKTYRFNNEAIQRQVDLALSKVPEGANNALVAVGSAELGVSWAVAVAYRVKKDWTITFAAAGEKAKPIGVEAAVIHTWN